MAAEVDRSVALSARCHSTERHLMPWLLCVAAFIPLGLAAYCWFAILDEIRRKLPLSEDDIRWAVAPYIWTSVMSKTARWRYVWFHLWSSIAFLLLGAAVWSAGNTLGAAIFAFIAAATIAWMIWQYRQRGA
jgi:hypothetical protein